MQEVFNWLINSLVTVFWSLFYDCATHNYTITTLRSARHIQIQTSHISTVFCLSTISFLSISNISTSALSTSRAVDCASRVQTRDRTRALCREIRPVPTPSQRMSRRVPRFASSDMELYFANGDSSFDFRVGTGYSKPNSTQTIRATDFYDQRRPRPDAKTSSPWNGDGGHVVRSVCAVSV